MTQYLLAVHTDFDAPPPGEDEMMAAFAAVDEFNADLQASGSWVFAGGLQAPDTATTVDATGGNAVMTDGPFAETKEQLGGFWVVTAPDLDAALDLAARASVACRERIEVRPFQHVSEVDEA